MHVHFRAFHGPTDWGWVQQHLPLKRVEDTGGIIAIDVAENRTVAACILDTWTEASVQAHLIVLEPMVIRHGFFEEVADYVFNVAGRKLMIGIVPANNTRALSVDKKIGFEEVCRIPEGSAAGVDAVVLTMRADQCRYHKPPEAHHGQGQLAPASA